MSTKWDSYGNELAVQNTPAAGKAVQHKFCVSTRASQQKMSRAWHQIAGSMLLPIWQLLTAVRAVIIAGAAYLQTGNFDAHKDYMSDHVFLGSALVAALSAEAAFVIMDPANDFTIPRSTTWQESGAPLSFPVPAKLNNALVDIIT